MGNRNLKFTQGEVGQMIGVLSELDPSVYEEDWAKAIIFKSKSLYSLNKDGLEKYRTYTVGGKS